MSKFILIDQSIEGKGGHYLEYAMNVLHAARQEGYEICLATNRKFTGSFDCEVLPVYTYNIWGKKRRRAGIFHKLAGKMAVIACRIRDAAAARTVIGKYSLFGQTVQMAIQGNFGEIMEMTSEKNVLLLLPLLLPAILIGIPAAVLFLLYRSFLAVFYLAAQLRVVRLAGSLGKERMEGLCQSWNKALSRLKGGGVSRGRWKKDFGRSTKKVLRYFQAGPGDIVFIPTLSETELMGVAELIKKHESACGPSWHMVFRRNLFAGREPVYRVTDKDVLTFRKILYRFVSLVDGRAATYFYTDTERLSAQYNELNITEFSTLPIPINPALQVPQRKQVQAPVNIVYLGDARREKGYQFLDGIVRDLWKDYALKGKVRFEFQSNFSFSDRKNNFDLVYGRQHMQLFCNAAVKLHMDALDSDAYGRLVREGDIGLLLYDRDNYYARSSGAYIECVCCEMPVIVPGASWMAIDLDEANYEYREQVRSQMQELMCLQSAWMNEAEYIRYGRGGLAEAAECMRIVPASSPESEGTLAFSSYENRAICMAVVPEDCQYLFLSYEMCEYGRQGNYARTRVTVFDEYGMECGGIQSDDCGADQVISIMLPLAQEAAYITVEMWNAFYEEPIFLVSPSIGFYRQAADRGLPLGTFGLTYSREEDVGELLRNIIDHYDLYKEEAIVRAKQYNEKHTARKLVRQISERKAV